MEEEKKLTRVQTFNIKPSLQQTKKLVSDLMKYVYDNKLAVTIAGKKYLQVEAWQFTGSQLSLTAIVTDIEEVAMALPKTGKPIYRYKATVEVIHNPTGQLVSRGFAMCTSVESKKRSFDEYAVASMAQTRAIGKAYRNILAWLPKLAGFEGTPVEEISDHVKEKMDADLAEVKKEVFSRFKEKGITDSQEMLRVIEKATGKTAIDTQEDATSVLLDLADSEL